LSFAASGKVRNKLNMTSLKSALELLAAQLDRPVDDPLVVHLRVLRSVAASRSEATRRLVYDQLGLPQ
jgi:hypothetical protein